MRGRKRSAASRPPALTTLLATHRWLASSSRRAAGPHALTCDSLKALPLSYLLTPPEILQRKLTGGWQAARAARQARTR